jgi:hypothetical protein
MIGGSGTSKQRSFFSLITSILLITSALFIGIPIQVPEVGAVGYVDHTLGNLDIETLSDYGRILEPLMANNKYQTVRDGLGMGFVGLVIDQDNYNHVPGTEDIADCFDTYPYAGIDDFKNIKDINMIINNGVTQKSVASFQNTGVGTGDPNDIEIEQVVWTVKNKDWAILQWTLKNLKMVPLTGVSIGLEVPISKAGATGGGGLGGDNGDDIDGYDAANAVYWASDDSGTSMGLGSALVSDPITHYFSEDYHADYFTEYKNFFGNDTWLYQRLHAPNSVVGSIPGNRTTTAGWNGITIDAGLSRTFTLVIAINDTLSNMMTAFKDAQYHYRYKATSFCISEFSDDQSGITPQKVEIYNLGREPTDLTGDGYFLSNDGGVTSLPGSWSPNTIPTFGYRVFKVFGKIIGSEGDTIGLYQDMGGGKIVLFDEVAFGQEGVVADPLNGESMARIYDAVTASYTDKYYLYGPWLRNASTGPTWGFQNDVVSIIFSPKININRVMFNPIDPVEGYIELMYKWNGIMDISGFRIVCDAEYIVPPQTVLSSTNRYYVLNQTNYPLNFDLDDGTVNGDNIYLYGNNGSFRDMVGWSSSHNKGEFMSRNPDGWGTYQGYDDTTSQAVGWVFDRVPSMMITEFFVDSGSATFEVYNSRGGDKILDSIPPRWTFDMDLGSLTGNWNPGTIPNKGYSIFTMSTGAPGDEGDSIGLLYKGTNLGDEISFGIKGVAPDPLIGESTARLWDASIGGYSINWTRALIPTFGAQNIVPVINPNPLVLLNEVMFNPIVAPDGRYIVIFNKWSFPIDVTRFTLVCDDYYKFPIMGIPSNSKFMINYTTAPSLFNSMDPAGDNVYLYDNLGRLMDMVGWNSQHIQGMSVRRIPDRGGTYQGYNDTTSEAAGWVFNKPIQAPMTEISDSGSSLSQIEVYNPWFPPINFSVGFTFESDSYTLLNGTWTTPSADSGGYALFEVDGSTPLNPEGDTIRFYQSGILNEEISYGQKGTVPDPLVNESVQRYWDGSSYTNVWERNRSSGTTFGKQNDVALPNLNSNSVLNEIMFNPSKIEEGVVEIYLKTGQIDDLSGYKIVGDTEFIIPAGTLITRDNRFYYLTQLDDPAFFAALNSSGDNIYLYDNVGGLMDMAGWSSAHDVDKTMARVPDGFGGWKGFNDITSEAEGWVFNQFPSYEFVRIYDDMQIWGDPGYSVWYPLNIIHYQGAADFIDVIVESENNWSYELYEDDRITLFVDKETPQDGLSDTGLLPPREFYFFWVRIFVPFPTNVTVERTNVIVQASSNTSWRDQVLLKTYVNPWVMPDAYIKDPPYPTTIYEKAAGTSGLTNETTVTLNATGMSYLDFVGQDVIFILDSSNSMRWNDPDPDENPGNMPFPQRVNASWYYIFNLSGSDRGGYVDFDSDANLNVSLTTNYSHLRADLVNGLWCSDQFGGKTMYPALSLANQELITNGFSNHVKVEILLTDAQGISLDDDLLCREQADIAAANNIIIFPIGLNMSTHGPPGGSDLLRYIAETTNGQYFTTTNASTLTAIFSQIYRLVNNIAGYKPNPWNEELMIKFVLDEGIDYINGTFQLVPGSIETDPNPDNVSFNPTNTTLEWKWVGNHIEVGESWAVRFNISSTISGKNIPVNKGPDSSVLYMTHDRNILTREFPQVTINVLPIPPTYPSITNVTIDPGGVNITWTSVLGAEFYEIYGGPSQTTLNLDLLDVLGIVSAPQTWWLDTVNLAIYDKYYYVVRALDTDTTPELRSQTSNTGGYYTKQFEFAVNTFSLPLEPFGNFYTDYYTTSMNAIYIKYMDSNTRTWLQHNLGDGSTNNIEMKLGEAYMVKFHSRTTYTFTGMPGAMIVYDNDNGFSGFDPDSEAKNLLVSVELNGDVNLAWQEPSSMISGDWYEVYYSNTRDGFFGSINMSYFLACPPISFGTNTITLSGLGAIDPGARLYFMVVPFNVSGVRGASTYSIGVWTEEYLAGYDTIGIPLKLSSYETADWFCDNIPNTIGINYFIYSGQRWSWHSTRMPEGAFDPILYMTEGYQISTSSPTKFTFIGV